MPLHPIPGFQEIEQSLSTKKERKSLFSNFGRPPKAPARSAPVRRIYSVFKDEAPKPISFREGSDLSFITGSPIYLSKRGTYFEQCYEIEKRLGEGDFGEVFKVISKENGKTYACKRNILKFRGKLDRARRIQEVKNHEKLGPHINIIKFYRAWEEDNQLYLLTEVCQQSLADILGNIHEFPERQIWNYFIDILQGLDHLHKNKCIHMDVKPENIFVGLDGRCKLGDFGLVVDFTNGYPTEALDGDPKYLAPECLQRVYTPAADIFSLGMVVLEMATDLYLPKAGPLWHELRNGNIPSIDSRGLSKELESTIKWMLEPDCTKRPTTSEVLNYKAVKRLIWRNNLFNVFTTKIEAIKDYLSGFFFILFFKLVTFYYKKRIFNYRRDFLVNTDQTQDESEDAGESGTNDLNKDLSMNFPMGDGRRSDSFPEPVYISTPVSSSKRKIFPLQDESFKAKSDDDDCNNADGSRYTFNESSFSSLEFSREMIVTPVPHTMPTAAPVPDSQMSTSITGKNLLELFNKAETSSDEDE